MAELPISRPKQTTATTAQRSLLLLWVGCRPLERGDVKDEPRLFEDEVKCPCLLDPIFDGIFLWQYL